MKKIHGRVLVKETNAGVPNLVVSAYDSESSMQDILTGHRIGKGFAPNTIAQLGRRIGSVLTDQNGDFAIGSDDLQFQGNESRPDLLIIIFAPEDIIDPQRPYPLPPESRILYISTAPRADAGAEEAFVIRLLQAQLDTLQIVSGTFSNKGETNSLRLASDIEDTWGFRDSLREKLRPRLLEEQKKSDRFKNEAADKTKELSAIPLHLRDGKDGRGGLRNNKYLIKDKKELGENLKRIQDDVMKDGLSRMRENKPTLRLHLTARDVEELGLNLEEGKVTGKVKAKLLSEKALSLMKGVDLVKVRGLDNPSPDELEKKYLVNKPAPKKGDVSVTVK
jgi:hypothetical protein